MIILPHLDDTVMLNRLSLYFLVCDRQTQLSDNRPVIDRLDGIPLVLDLGKVRDQRKFDDGYQGDFRLVHSIHMERYCGQPWVLRKGTNSDSQHEDEDVRSENVSVSPQNGKALLAAFVHPVRPIKVLSLTLS